jgi:hypothetical protein
MASTPLGILDLIPIPSGSAAAQALRNRIDLRVLSSEVRSLAAARLRGDRQHPVVSELPKTSRASGINRRAGRGGSRRRG